MIKIYTSLRSSFRTEHHSALHTLFYLLLLLLPLSVWSTTPVSPDIANPALPPHTSANWWGDIQQNIQQTEYHISATSNSDTVSSSLFQAPNRAHNLRTYFYEEGIRIEPRDSGKTYWTWGLSLKGIGTESRILPVIPPERIVEGKVTISAGYRDRVLSMKVTRDFSTVYSFSDFLHRIKNVFLTITSH